MKKRERKHQQELENAREEARKAESYAKLTEKKSDKEIEEREQALAEKEKSLNYVNLNLTLRVTLKIKVYLLHSQRHLFI